MWKLTRKRRLTERDWEILEYRSRLGLDALNALRLTTTLLQLEQDRSARLREEVDRLNLRLADRRLRELDQVQVAVKLDREKHQQ